ncbi:MAG: hemin uptake protein HemP [Pseudomonadota bacterium]
MNMMPQPIEVEQSTQLADIASEDLFGDNTVLTISHREMIYTLRITRQGKLLLTK